MIKKESIIVLSGGLDSTTLLYDKQAEIGLAVTFKYGSNHEANEIPCAAYHCQKLGIEHLIIDLDFMSRMHSSLLSGAEDIPTGTYGEDNMKSTVVPFRNGVMLSIAGAIAEDRGLKRVLIANHFGDHAIYPDCTAAFIKGMNAAIQAGTYNAVEVAAPYTGINKEEIVAIGTRLGVDYGHTWSCYKGGDKPCGVCATCQERIEAFRKNGITDPLEYINE
ncbi:MAG: 7-cyano-7-deazaguanine synthase QueC [Porphyromonas sp.]|nr:7-cyano-7-deazaguanine synthase QueC [Porphyromonas sp.]